MSNWKQIIIKCLLIGAGIAITLAIIVGTITWYSGRPKAWNTSAISTQYSHVSTEGKENTFVFYYYFQNNTKMDWRINEYSNIEIVPKMGEQDALSTGLEAVLTCDKTVFTPPQHKSRVGIHLKIRCPVNRRNDMSSEERKEFRSEVERYLAEEKGVLNGFILFDNTNRYAIQLESGWKYVDTETKSFADDEKATDKDTKN